MKSEQVQPNADADPPFVDTLVMARKLSVSPSFLQKDRKGARRIPFIQLGDRCLYEPAAVFEAVRAMSVGGGEPSGLRMRRVPRAKR